LQDVLETDVVVLWGANVANNQPVFTKYLYEAKKNGAKVIVINPYLEPGLENYWVPSKPESFLFGTKLCDLHIPVRPEGDVSLANALLKELIERDAIDHDFVEQHTIGWTELTQHLATFDIEDLLGDAGIDHATLTSLADLYASSQSAVLIWSMGITQHRYGVEGVQAIVNVALARGNVGRNGSGLMPIRGHSGVQGGAEMGAYATAFPGGITVSEESALELSTLWGFAVPSTPGITAPEMVLSAERDELDVLYLDGSNFLDVMPDPQRVEAALSRVPLRVHQDIVLTSQMFIDGDDVILLPAATRYEQEGGGTSTTTERQIAFSPEIVSAPGEARSEWRIFSDIATRMNPTLAPHFSWTDNKSLRTEIAQVVPMYAGIENLSKTHDAIQYGGRHLCEGGEFPLPNGRARFTNLTVSPPTIPEGSFFLSTRRGKQFNSMIFNEIDPLTGATRDAVYIDARDAAMLKVVEGDRVLLRSDIGSMNARVKIVALPSRSVQVHWPEGNVLIDAGLNEDASRIPDYNAVVTIEKINKG
jgi:molybdopterin-dependent oxidoreductase alpha subunit